MKRAGTRYAARRVIQRLLLTGPLESLASFAAAARGAGWEALEFPLIEIVELPAELAADAAACSAVCVTSSSALPALARASERVRALPLFVVGARTAERAQALGLAPVAPPAADAADLAARVARSLPQPARLLWPRGSHSDELARRLRAAGFAVDERIVYATRVREARGRPPESAAVFFASPSAVQTWFARPPAARTEPAVAIAIGATTAAALRGETAARFAAILALPEPTESALARALTNLEPRRTP